MKSKMASKNTLWMDGYLVGFELGTKETDTLEDLFDFAHIPDMEDWLGEFKVAKVTRTFVHASITGGALKVTVIRPQAHIQQTTRLGQISRLIIGLGNLNLGNRTCFLYERIRKWPREWPKQYDFFRGKNSKLDPANLSNWNGGKGGCHNIST